MDSRRGKPGVEQFLDICIWLFKYFKKKEIWGMKWLSTKTVNQTDSLEETEEGIDDVVSFRFSGFLQTPTV